MTTIENRQLIAAELDAAAHAYRTAVGSPDAAAEERAGDRWRTVVEVAQALLSADHDEDADHDEHAYYPGDRVAWLNTAQLAEGEPLALYDAIVREEAYPVAGYHYRPGQRLYAVEVATEYGDALTEHVAYSGDLVLMPAYVARRTERPR
ncbi:hypothetical protein [Nocardia carnea]|uniref:hypothetical protein n=1 Tax=Nocardia carnea TaxID=37328 RepID=UPI002455A27B|nr:hypothetical protein [Nocardia carnea]